MKKSNKIMLVGAGMVLIVIIAMTLLGSGYCKANECGVVFVKHSEQSTIVSVQYANQVKATVSKNK